MLHAGPAVWKSLMQQGEYEPVTGELGEPELGSSTEMCRTEAGGWAHHFISKVWGQTPAAE